MRSSGGRRGGEVGAGAVQACGVAPPAGSVAGDVDADFHHQLGFYQRDVQCFASAPLGGERPARPRMAVPGRSKLAGDRGAGRRGEGGGAAGVLQAPVVVPAEQQTTGSGQGAGDSTDDRLRGLVHLVFLPASAGRPVGIVQPLEEHALDPDRGPRQPLAHGVRVGGRRTQHLRRDEFALGEDGLEGGSAPPVGPSGCVRPGQPQDIERDEVRFLYVAGKRSAVPPVYVPRTQSPNRRRFCGPRPKRPRSTGSKLGAIPIRT